MVDTHVALEDQLWSVRVVGTFLGGKSNKPLSRGAIARLVQSGVLPPPILIGQSRRWRKSAILAAVARIEASAQKVEQKIQQRRVRASA